MVGHNLLRHHKFEAKLLSLEDFLLSVDGTSSQPGPKSKGTVSGVSGAGREGDLAGLLDKRVGCET